MWSRPESPRPKVVPTKCRDFGTHVGGSNRRPTPAAIDCLCPTICNVGIGMPWYRMGGFKFNSMAKIDGFMRIFPRIKASMSTTRADVVFRDGSTWGAHWPTLGPKSRPIYLNLAATMWPRGRDLAKNKISVKSSKIGPNRVYGGRFGSKYRNRRLLGALRKRANRAGKSVFSQSPIKMQTSCAVRYFFRGVIFLALQKVLLSLPMCSRTRYARILQPCVLV